MLPSRLRRLAAAAALATTPALTLMQTAPARAATPVPAAPSCPVFPADNVWNTDISTLPVNPRSAAWMASMNSASTLIHPDFGPSFGAQPVPYGMPYTVVSNSHPTTPMQFLYASESDPGPYPFDGNTPIEGGQNASGDRHAIMINKDTCTLYELYDAQYSPGGSTAGSGAIWNLRSDALRPASWTSADAAGLPIMPGLLRLDEVESGVVSHAIRFTAAQTDTSYLWPARHQAGTASDPNLPPMGARFRLKAGFAISGFSPQAQVILRAMQHYGLIVADNGSNWYFQGSQDPGWDSNLLDELKSVPASAFEAIDESSLMVDPNSGQARRPFAPGPSGGPGGYRLVASDGGIFAYGSAGFFGSAGSLTLNRPIVGMAATPSGRGYWEVATDGGIFSFGDARFRGSTGALVLNRPIVAMAATPTGAGYWLAGSDGGIFAFGDARFAGSTGGMTLNRPIVGMAATPSGHGYWLVASDGGIFAFGDAGFYGSTGAMTLNQPIVGMAATPSGHGYWLVASDGGIFAFGDARFAGSTGGMTLNRPIVAMAASPSGNGYWEVASDGGIFNWGDASFHGSAGSLPLNRPIVSMD